jgi:hypothetical protein
MSPCEKIDWIEIQKNTSVERVRNFMVVQIMMVRKCFRETRDVVKSYSKNKKVYWIKRIYPKTMNKSPGDELNLIGK